MNHLTQLQKTIQAKNKLRNMFREKKLIDLGLYEEASKLQKPTIEAITASSEESKKLVVKNNNNNPQIEDVQNKRFINIKPLDKEQLYTNKYVLQRTTKTLNINEEDHRVWLLGKHFFILVEKDNQEYIINYSLRDSQPIELTEGLNEILFNNGNNKDIITPQDIKTWDNLMNDSNMSGYKTSTYWKAIVSKPSTSPIIEEIPDTPKKGEGLKPIIIPSNPMQLGKELLLQLAACKAGNNNTFNTSNALMKELLKQKLISGKDYRDILRKYYHI
jgi:hypothetical protein